MANKKPKNDNDRKEEIKKIISSRIKGELNKKGWKRNKLLKIILEDVNKLMMFPSTKRKDKICHKSRFVIVNGNIYPEAIYENQDFGISEHTSYYDLVNSVSKDNNLFGIKYIRELHSAYRRDRYLYGGLGRLTDIDFFLLNYMMGYFFKKQG